MILKTIQLQQFRLFENQVFDFHPKLTIIIGENTRGKTSLLEGVYTSIFGEGFRESKEEEMIMWDKELGNVNSVYAINEGDKSQFQVIFKHTGDTTTKNYLVDRTKKTHYSYLQFQTRAVLFTPDNIEIITGPPSGRRTYFDKVLSAAYLEYKKKLTNYENALRKRNKVLEGFRGSDSALKEELQFWNDYLIEHARFLNEMRAAYVDFLNEKPEIQSKSFKITYLPNVMSEERLEQRFELEKRMRKTSIGPQKDDFEITITGEDVSKNVHLYGSRSEQRLSMFWLKLAEVRYLEQATKKRPLLLLDDVFSELDTRNKKMVMEFLPDYQTILTTTEDELLDIEGIDKEVIRL